MPRGLTVALAASIVLLLALIGIVAYPRFAPPPAAALRVSTEPAGATVAVDGRAVGTTGEDPLLVPDLDVGDKYVVTAAKPGYETADTVVSPRDGKPTPLTLVLAPRTATLVVASEPSGATVVVDGDQRGQTPLVLADLEPGSKHEVTLRKSGYLATTQNVEAPAPGREVRVVASLPMSPELASVAITSRPPGARIYQNGELLAGTVTPVRELVLEAGKRYRLTVEADGYMPVTRTIKLRRGQRRRPVRIDLAPGGSLTVHVNVRRARIAVAGVKRCRARGALDRCPLPDGEYTVHVTAKRPYVSEQFKVTVDGDDASHDLELGFVEAASADYSLRVADAPEGTHRVAMSAGRRSIVVVDTRTGKQREVDVDVVPGRTITVGGT
jgi:hypothetical protein